MARRQVEKITCDGCGKDLASASQMSVITTQGFAMVDLCQSCAVGELSRLLGLAPFNDAMRRKWLDDRTTWDAKL